MATISDPFATFATNEKSKFIPFSLALKNGGTITGISHIPTSGSHANSKYKPLLICIHGATCSAHAWDVTPEYTASKVSADLGIPIVAFHRPNFLRSSGWMVDNSLGNPNAPQPRFTRPEGSTMFQEEARWYHEYIFPVLWETFGIPNGCTSLVTNSHSMSVPVTTIAAGLYSSSPEAERGYPWSGMVITGFANQRSQVLLTASDNLANNVWDPADLPYGNNAQLGHIQPFLKEDKIALMLGPPGCCEDHLGELVWKQNTPFFLQEVLDMIQLWFEKGDEFKAVVKIPVLYGMGSLDWLWKHSRSDVEAFLAGFTNAPRVEGAIVAGAPHAIEMSRMAGAWWLRLLGWALEVSTSKEMEVLNLPEYE